MLDPELRQRILDRDGERCWRCGSTERLTIDHTVPVSRGGTDAEDNLRVYCLGCNSAKGNRDDPRYLRPIIPGTELEDVARACEEHEAARAEYVAALNDAVAEGFSYAEIGRAAGVSRQASRQLCRQHPGTAQ